jgi:hypothetical protein
LWRQDWIAAAHFDAVVHWFGSIRQPTSIFRKLSKTGADGIGRLKALADAGLDRRWPAIASRSLIAEYRKPYRVIGNFQQPKSEIKLAEQPQQSAIGCCQAIRSKPRVSELGLENKCVPRIRSLTVGSFDKPTMHGREEHGTCPKISLPERGCRISIQAA